MTNKDMLKKLKGFIYSEHGTAKDYALFKMVSPAFISGILTGKKKVTDEILADIGLYRDVKTIYVEL